MSNKPRHKVCQLREGLWLAELRDMPKMVGATESEALANLVSYLRYVADCLDPKDLKRRESR